MPAPGSGDVPGATPAALPLALLSLPLMITMFLLLLETTSLLLITTTSLPLLITTISLPLLSSTISLQLLITAMFVPLLITNKSLPLLITTMTLPLLTSTTTLLLLIAASSLPQLSTRSSVTRAAVVDSPPLTVRRLSGEVPWLFLWRESMVVTTPVLLVVITSVSISALLDFIPLVMRSFFELPLSLGHVDTGHVVYQRVMISE